MRKASDFRLQTSGFRLQTSDFRRRNPESVLCGDEVLFVSDSGFKGTISTAQACLLLYLKPEV
jgi:hypothetical protein